MQPGGCAVFIWNHVSDLMGFLYGSDKGTAPNFVEILGKV
jgi:hypothetical protein